jgi:hypothetical protein
VSLQRKRGQTALVYPTKKVTNNRGTEVLVTDMDNPTTVRAAFVPSRSARAEVPGQQEIDVFTMLVRSDLTGLTLWSTVEWNGSLWDIVTPPAYHHGERNTRHWSIDIRRRAVKREETP